MRGFTQATIVGNITRDLDIKKTKSGKSVLSFSVAVNNRDEVSFIDCVAWESAAEALSKFLGKGSPILLSGELKQSTFEVDGNKRSKLELIVRTFVFINDRERPEAGKSEDILPDDDEVTDEPIDMSQIPF